MGVSLWNLVPQGPKTLVRTEVGVSELVCGWHGGECPALAGKVPMALPAALSCPWNRSLLASLRAGQSSPGGPESSPNSVLNKPCLQTFPHLSFPAPSPAVRPHSFCQVWGNLSHFWVQQLCEWDYHTPASVSQLKRVQKVHFPLLDNKIEAPSCSPMAKSAEAFLFV